MSTAGRLKEADIGGPLDLGSAWRVEFVRSENVLLPASGSVSPVSTWLMSDHLSKNSALSPLHLLSSLILFSFQPLPVVSRTGFCLEPVEFGKHVGLNK